MVIAAAIGAVAAIILLGPFSPATLQSMAIGLAVPMNRSESPLFPRWMGYFDLCVAMVFAAGAPTLFVKHGAFGWDGILARRGGLRDGSATTGRRSITLALSPQQALAAGRYTLTLVHDGTRQRISRASIMLR